ncbi:metallophosphoesterase family protein [Methanocaldococcus sp.]
MIAVISDVHANLEALEAVLDDIKERGIKEIYVLGDIVDYGANPNECIELLKDYKCVAGNHDLAVLGKEVLYNFNDYAIISILWTKRVIKEENLKFLKSLPLVIKKDRLVFCHSNPKNPTDWEYLTPNYVDKAYECGDFVFVGHSHMAFISEEKDLLLVREGDIKVKEGKRYVINVGSVGQPRDNDNRACYCLFDYDRIELVRVEYDIDKAYEKIVKAGLPKILGERLYLGI